MKLISRKFEKIEGGFRVIEEGVVENSLNTKSSIEFLYKGKKDILINREKLRKIIQQHNNDIDIVVAANKDLDLGIEGLPEKFNEVDLVGTYEEEEEEKEEAPKEDK